MSSFQDGMDYFIAKRGGEAKGMCILMLKVKDALAKANERMRQTLHEGGASFQNQTSTTKETFMSKSNAGAVLTEDVELKGTIYFNSSAEVNGRFEGEIYAEGPLVIGEKAVIRATIHGSSSVEVWGKMQGNVEAKEKVELKGNAELYGDVRTPKFVVSEGVVFVGNSDTLNGKSSSVDFSSLFTQLGKGKEGGKAQSTGNGGATSGASGSGR